MATTIALQEDTKERLRRLGEKGESYDTIVRKLLDPEVSPELNARWNKILAEEEFFPLEELRKDLDA